MYPSSPSRCSADVVTIATFDSDSGFDLVAEVLTSILERNFEVRVVELPGGADPDDFVRDAGAEAYARLREFLGLESRPIRVFDPVQQLAIVDEDVLDRFGIDIIEVGYLSDDESKPPAARCTASYLETLSQDVHGALIDGMICPLTPAARARW